MLSVGGNIETYRIKAQMTQEDLAKKLDVSFQLISQWERGYKMPNVERLVQIAKALGVTTVELAGG